MKTITTREIPRQPLNLVDYKLRSALETDFTELIKGSTIIKENGIPKIFYFDLDDFEFDSAPLLEALGKIKFNTSQRSGGLTSTSRVFGYYPRVTMHKDFCSTSGLASEAPDLHKIVCDYAAEVSKLYNQIDPDIYRKHNTISQKVLPEWKIENTPFTSGIINKNNPLKYHFDSGNFTDVYSCMLGFKHNIRGGYLAIPEYGIGLEIKNNSLLVFDGQRILHGVTPIYSGSSDAFRYTIVYYSLKQMWNCMSVTDELIRIRSRKTAREFKRAEDQAFKNIR
jgi:hypothetical protein